MFFQNSCFTRFSNVYNYNHCSKKLAFFNFYNFFFILFLILVKIVCIWFNLWPFILPKTKIWIHKNNWEKTTNIYWLNKSILIKTEQKLITNLTVYNNLITFCHYNYFQKNYFELHLNIIFNKLTTKLIKFHRVTWFCHLKYHPQNYLKNYYGSNNISWEITCV